MKESKFLTLTLNDWVKGLITTVIAAVITALYEGIIAGKPLDLEFLKTIGMVALTAGLAYILNKLGTNSADEFGRTENSEKAIQMRMGVRKGAGILLLLMMFSFVGSAQSPWKGFWKPVTDDAISSSAAGTGQWLFQPTVQITAMQLTWSKETKNFNASSLQSAGPGLSYSHYIDVNGEPYNNFSVNGILLFGLKPGETVESTISLAGTVSALEIISVGAGYNFTIKEPFILTGVVIRF